MFRTLPDLPHGVIGFEAVGEIHPDDYRHVLRPALDDAAASGGIRLVFVLGREFSSYTAGAAWEDAKLATHHLSAWERTALVSDVDWVTHMAGAFGWMVPGQFRTFAVDDVAEAVRWTAGDPVPGAEGSAAPTGDDATTGEPSAEGPEAADGGGDAPGAVVAPVALGAQSEGSPFAPQPSGASDASESTSFDPTPSDPTGVGADPEPAPPEPVPEANRPAPPEPVAPSVPEQWAPDPSGRHQYRWWNGKEWTEHVADNGVNGVDPVR